MKQFLILAAAAGLLAACGNDGAQTSQSAAPSQSEAGASAEATQSDVFRIEDAYLRAPLAGSDKTAAYLKISSSSETGAFLVGAATPAAETAELHTHTLDGGLMKMRQVEMMDIPAGGTLELRPMSNHIMLFGVSGDLEDGDETQITLMISADGDLITLTETIPVRALK